MFVPTALGALMRHWSTWGLSLVALSALTMGTGCGGALVQPGHRAIYFDPSNGGIQHEVLQPGWYRTPCAFWVPENRCPRVDDFDVTYSTAKEELHTLSKEGLGLELHTALKYRPIVSELYLLDTEIGPNYFDEVIGPELRSATIGVMAATSYADLQKKNGVIEDEIEKALRQRLQGKHIEISSVLIEKVEYAPEIIQSLKERVVSQEQTLARKQLLENEALQKKRELELAAETKKLELEKQTEQKRMELEADAEQRKLAAQTEADVSKIEVANEAEAEKARLESALRNKVAQKREAIEEGEIERIKAEAGAATAAATARGQSSARLALARASAAESAASSASVTSNQVMMHAYDALGKLGGTGTTFLLGDYSKLPNWLFPKMSGFQTAPVLMTPSMPPARQAAAEPPVGAKQTKYAIRTWTTPPDTATDDNPY
jgi:regulator of protease activity HflC (stomatin/prohibitin superfamily)